MGRQNDKIFKKEQFQKTKLFALKKPTKKTILQNLFKNIFVKYVYFVAIKYCGYFQGL